MKKRTFFTTLLLFLVFFNAAILFITTVMQRENIRTQKERCLAEHYVIASSLIRDLQALEGRQAEPDAALAELMNSYAYFSQDRKMGLAVYRGEEEVFSNIENLEDAARDLSHLTQENRKVSMEGRERPALTIAGRLAPPYDGYALVYRYDMTETLEPWRQMKNTLYLCGGLFSVLLAFCLLLLLGRIFRPLGQISEAAESIAAGSYQKRLPLSGQDELATVARSFNHMADEVESQMTELREAAEQKQRFVDNLAHELRTPLTTIYGYAEYLQRAAASPEDRLSAAGYILDECKRMEQMSLQLLDLAMLRGDVLAREQVSVSRLFRQVERTARGKAAEKELTVTFESTLDALTGSEELLKILLLNLTDNAMKACGPGGRVTLRAFREEGAAVLSVEDTGRGMSPEQLLHVKEAFYRVDKARNRKDGGAGLGLALCEEIARLHRGRMELSSQLHHGTTVKIFFTTC